MAGQPLLSLKDGRELSLVDIEEGLTTASLILTGVIGTLEGIMADTDLYDSFYPKMHLVIAATSRAVDLIETAIPDLERSSEASRPESWTEQGRGSVRPSPENVSAGRTA